MNKKAPGKFSLWTAAPPLCAGYLAFCGLLLLGLYFVNLYLPCALLAVIFLYTGLSLIPLLFPQISKKAFFARLASELAVLAAAAAGYVFLLKRKTVAYSLSWADVLILILIFILSVIAEKIIRHGTAEDRRSAALGRTIISFCIFTRIAVIPLFICEVIRLLGFYETLSAGIWAESILASYLALFALVNTAVRFIRSEDASEPDFSVPLPFLGKKEYGILGYLENQTGITMRSLWSLKFAATLLPWAAVTLFLLVWLSSGIHTVNPYETGVLIRCGTLKDTSLEPGIHLTLPWPFDTVEKYETGTVKKITVGYESSGDTDNIWTDTHGTKEFKLLLGGGNELVSVNLRLEYKICNLDTYLRASSSPEGMLRGMAYELITDTVVRNDLDSLLSADRSSFASSFETALTDKLEERGGIGIEIVSVVLESIHPPVDVAEKYQQLISAEIQAEQIVLQAESYSALTLGEAETARDTAINQAEASKYQKIAEARASVTEFMAAVSADSSYSDAYRYHKYLNSICAAYKNSKLVLIGDSVNRSNIWIGSIPAASD